MGCVGGTWGGGGGGAVDSHSSAEAGCRGMVGSLLVIWLPHLSTMRLPHPVQCDVLVITLPPVMCSLLSSQSRAWCSFEPLGAGGCGATDVLREVTLAGV